ncbi:MAG: type II toxin-antitoxin system YoeB family toxin [Candidatus Pacearchaeota archaeon]|nr:type II toxin-antitoxin system YoeB family toxin [Candidatus Pacearchaeota archaeon]
MQERFKMFRGKEIIIKLSNEADKVYQELNKTVGEEKMKGIESSFHQTLLRSINRVRDMLKQNPFAGDQVPKRQIPGKYILKYDVDNLWRIELADRWRLIYTITGNQIEIINFVVDIFNHRDYDKVFGYKH